MREAIKSLFSGFEREVWIRFFVALGGLSLAFAAAVFSTVARRSGNLWATAILASSALLVAGVVAITTVPYLARRVAITRVRDAFDYDVTRQGVVYMVLVLVIGIAALNTGNNLLFIIVSAMLAAILVSGVASAGVLRGLEMDASIPDHLFAGNSVMGRLTLRNTRRRVPSFSVSIVPPRQQAGRHWRWRHSVFSFPPNRPREEQWIHWPDIWLQFVTVSAPESSIFSGTVYFPFLPPRAAVAADVQLKFDRRGRYRQEGFGVATRFPFAFLTKTRRIELAREVIAYPSVEPTDEFFEVLPMITGEFEAFIRGRGHDLYLIRDHMPEDSARHVDWKATAKSMTLKVREFTREDERKLRIVFDNPAPGIVPSKAYESAVALAASLGWHFAAEPADLSFVAPGFANSDVYEFLRYLALVQPAEGRSVLDNLQVTDDYNVVVTSRARGSIPTQLWASSYFIFMEQE
ncbi:MAG: DUF58 domain-containing protein [Acidobacteriia bacterium]|nr:DUF58 domain-containing protein [Terriglobia bacterium]